MAPTEGRVATPEQRWGCHRGTPITAENYNIGATSPGTKRNLMKFIHFDTILKHDKTKKAKKTNQF